MTDNEDERIRALMHRIDTDPTPVTPTDEMWPSIRARIEAAKVEQLGESGPPRRERRWLVPSMAVAAAAVLLIALALVNERRQGASAVRCELAADGCQPSADSPSALTLVSDSTRNYEDETRALLNDLELRRSMLRPEAVAAIDHDLRVVDSAIAEVKDALNHDPNNPALRRLLASSYREKLSVLQRVGNAG